MRRATALALLLVASASPRAPTRAQEPPSLALYVAADLAVDRGALRASLAEELGRDVVLVETAAAPGELLLVEAPGNELRVTYRNGPGDRAERRLPDAPGDPVERTRMVALVAAHLARDESLEILQLLLGRPDAEPVDAPPPADEVEGADVPAEATPAPPLPPTEPAPAVVPVAAPALALPPLRDPGPRSVSMGVDLAPGVGTSTFHRGRDRRHFSLGLFGAWSGGVEGAALSAGVDVAIGDVVGAQLAGLGAYTHETVKGAQLAGVAALSRDHLLGAQLAGGASLAWGDLHGLQASGAVSLTRGSVRGVQFGPLGALVGGDLRGMQVGTVGWVRGSVRGGQLGVITMAGDAVGGQLGLLNVSAGDLRGAQIGLVNVARGRVRGAQVGLINVAKDADVAVGFVNAYQDSRRRLRITIDSDAVLRGELHHGSRYVRSLLVVGAPLTSDRHVRAGWGLGTRFGVGRGFELSFDVLGLGLFPLAEQEARPDLLTELRASVSVPLKDGLALVAAAALQTQLSWRAEPLGGVGRLHRTRLDEGVVDATGTELSEPIVLASPLLSVGLELR